MSEDLINAVQERLGIKKEASMTLTPEQIDAEAFARAIEAAARQKALEEAAEVCAEISKDYWMGDCQFEAATRCRNAILAMGKEGGQHGAE